VYPAWGWGTDDGARALTYLKRFGSVTVLNGHIHQTMQKVEGNVTFHTALSTAFPQPRPGTAPAPGPMVVPANQLRYVLGIRQVRYVAQQRHLAIVDETLSGESPAAAMAAGEAAARASAPAPATATAPARPGAVTITNFAFTPGNIQIAAGDRVSWTNDDDVPHRIQSANSAFAPSAVLDTKGTYDVALTRPGEYKYFCSLHPMMTGTIVVR
jgi:plastocyanin